MKLSLIATAVLSLMVLSTKVHAEPQSPPPSAPVQIIQAGKIVTQITVSSTPNSSEASDIAATAKEKQAEASFKTSAPATSTLIIQPANQAPNTSNQVSVVTAIAVSAPKNEKIAIAKTSAPSPASALRADGATFLTAHCMTLKRHKLKCMNLEISRAETAAELAETKLLNCAQLRKMDGDIAPAAIGAFVVNRMYRLRRTATQSFDEEMKVAGQVSRLKAREIELRATINHEENTESFASKVCRAPAFKKLYAKSLAEASSN